MWDNKTCIGRQCVWNWSCIGFFKSRGIYFGLEKSLKPLPNCHGC